MKNGSRLIWISLAAVGCALAANCSSSDTAGRALGKVGESCSSRDDCDSLACINGVCTVEGQSDGDAGPTLVLGQVGESCRARADCTLGLVCINQVCTTGGDAAQLSGVGQRGESCQTRADCAGGLACVAGVCAVADYGLAPTGKECVAVACKVVTDCCPREPPTCKMWREQCALAADAGTDYYCQNVALYCNCDETKYTCEADKCLSKMSCADSGIPCPYGFVCNGKECVQCVKNDDCPSIDQICSAEKCVAKCTYDTDCPGFQKCQAGACIDAGCKTNRECIAMTRNVLSTCDTASGKCRTPCANDRECVNVVSMVGAYSICVDGYCADAGCETDEECKILLQSQIGIGTAKYAECRPKAK
jgi:hypothetical protein